MTEPTDIDALIAEFRILAAGSDATRAARMSELADYQRGLKEELRQAKSDLAHAQESIESIRSLPSYQAEELGGIYHAVDADEVADILDIYDEKLSGDG